MPVLISACMLACLLAILAQGLGALYSPSTDFRPAGVIMLELIFSQCDARLESRLPGVTVSVSLVRECGLQGDLTDPSYFDFISFAQLATISREIPKGQQEFEVCNSKKRSGSSAAHSDTQSLRATERLSRLRAGLGGHDSNHIAVRYGGILNNTVPPRYSWDGFTEHLTGQTSAQEFCEECEDRTKMVRREPELRSNASLPAAFERATGERIYDGLRNGFRVPIALPDTLWSCEGLLPCCLQLSTI